MKKYLALLLAVLIQMICHPLDLSCCVCTCVFYRGIQFCTINSKVSSYPLHCLR